MKTRKMAAGAVLTLGVIALVGPFGTIPCIDNTISPPPAGAPNELRNDCGGDDARPGQGHAAQAARRTSRQ